MLVGDGVGATIDLKNKFYSVHDELRIAKLKS